MRIAMHLETMRLPFLTATAADLMTRNPVSISQNATLKEALVLFTKKGLAVAPVIDRAGRAVGVLSSSDILVHEREKVEYLVPAQDEFPVEHSPLETADGEAIGRGFQVENVDVTRVRDLMTPAVFSVFPTTRAPEIVEEMLRLHVHHLFVVDSTGTLAGVISPLDILRKLELSGVRE
jgi:CBS domain-containing protein